MIHINQLRDIMNQVNRLLKSQKDKIKNANKYKLSSTAYGVYLLGLSSLGKCEAFAEDGNKGRGYSLPIYTKVEVTV